MMKRTIFALAISFVALVACEDDDVNLFEKSADERSAEAIANLKQELVAPANGWVVRYTPQEGSGSYYVLLDFQQNDKVVIHTDLGAEAGRYFEDTVSYRIDNSLGLELIIENYSVFAFLFEQDQATFGAEYQFNYVNKTPDNALVFRSKTDLSIPDVIVFEEASANDVNLLGVNLARNLNTLSGDLDKFTSSLKLAFSNRDLALYLSLDELRRTVTVTSASLKSNTNSTQNVGFTTPYIVPALSATVISDSAKDNFGFAGGSSSLHDEMPNPRAVNRTRDRLNDAKFFMTVWFILIKNNFL